MELLAAKGVDSEDKLAKVAEAIAGHTGVDEINAKLLEARTNRAKATEPFDIEINALEQERRDLLKKFGIGGSLA